MGDIGGTLDDGGIEPRTDPVALFASWFAEAAKSEPNEPEAMALATADEQGRPNLRMVLLKAADASGFVFYTNLQSAKGRELAHDSHAALCFHWKTLRRQVRVRGPAEQVSDAEADAYFATRPRDSQIGAWASAQSRPMELRFAFEREIARYAAKFALRQSTASRFLVRISGDAARDRVLARPPVSFARSARLPPPKRNRALADGAALSVRNGSRRADLHANSRLMKNAALAAVALSAFLVVLKAAAYVITGSVAMMASLADSALDLFASSINLLAISQSLTPADREHRFGHGKAEPLAGLAQGAFIAGSATFLVVESIGRIVSPRRIEHAALGLLVMAISIGTVLALVLYQRLAVSRTGSLAIQADRLHYMGDLVTNIGVVIGIAVASRLGILIADPIVGLGVAAALTAGAWQVVRQSYDQLMDRELPESERDRIKAIVLGHAEVRSLHDLRTRAAGISRFIQLHIELDPAISLTRAHELSDCVEADILSAYPDAQVIIHQDPAGIEKPPPLARS